LICARAALACASQAARHGGARRVAAGGSGMAKVARKTQGDVAVVALKGSFFGDSETDDLMKSFNELVEQDNKKLIIDFSGCDAINSLAISVLMRTHANYAKREGEIKVCGLDKRIKSTFVMTKLILVFDHHDTEAQAVAAFGG
jgi:anti-anti-sigma factor